MAYVPLLYSLGWPGMESLPCVVVDHVTRDVYTNTNKLPLNKLYLNTTANKYVELSAVLKLFPQGKDKDAMHNFMTISSEFGMRKFFMDRLQRAYISLDTLLVYMIVYPYCPEFLQARSEVARFLQSYRELPCYRCGFIQRDCRCNSHLLNESGDGVRDIVGYATEQLTQQTQTDFGNLANELIHGTSKIIMSSKVKEPVSTVCCSTQTWIAPPSQKTSFTTGSTGEKEKPSVKITPINVVAPLKARALMVDASCQTRANFDFNVKSRVKTMPSSVVKESDSPGTSVFTIGNDKTGSSITRENVSSFVPALPNSQSNTILPPKQPLKISLWKLLESDSSDDDSVNKNKVESHPTIAPLPQSLDFSNEPKESNTTEKLTEVERSLLQEAEKIAPATQSPQTKVEGKGGGNASLGEKSPVSASSGEKKDTVGQNHIEAMGRVITDNTHATEPVKVVGSLNMQEDSTKDGMNEELTTEEMDTSVEVTMFEALSERKEMASCEFKHSESDVVKGESSGPQDINSGDAVNQDNTPSDLDASLAQEHTLNVTPTDSAKHDHTLSVSTTASEESVVRKSMSPEKCLVIDEQSTQGNHERELTPGSADRAASETGSDLPGGRDVGISKHVMNNAELSNNTEKPSFSKLTTAGDTVAVDTVHQTSAGAASGDVTQDISDEKPKMSYKKWCHKFEYTPTSEKLYRCTFLRCGQCFDTKKAAVLHNKVHGAFGQENPAHIICFKCDYTTSLNKWFDIVRHLKFKHNELITNHEFGCYLCGRDFASSEKLNKHIDFHYSGRYKCVHCGSVLFTWKQVEEHVQDSCESRDKKEKNLGCPYCPLVFHIRNMRNAHMLSHQDKGLVCAFCDSDDIWENWKQLRKHYQQKHPHKIRSVINPHKKKEGADAKISRPALQSFKVDIKRNPVCNLCEEEFEGDEDFFYHMSKKHDFVPYVLSVCEICEKTFRTYKMFEWHMRNTHSEDIRCDKCNFVAKTHALLKSHIQSRHQDREHTCVECGKDFSHYRELRMHMARHAIHTIYCCDICGEEFKRQRELRHHSNTVHPKQSESLQQECLECDYRCYTRRAMEAHVRKHHPRLAEEIEECENEPPPKLYKPGKMCPTPPTITPQPAVLDTSVVGTVTEQDSEQTVETTPVTPTIPRPNRSGSKKNRKKLKKLHSTEPKVLTEKEEERRRLKREKKEKIEKLRFLVKVSSARTRTYEDFRNMLSLNLIEHPQEQTIDHEKTQIIYSEHDILEQPLQKRQKVSKYGRSIVSKPLDDIYVSGTSEAASEKYVEQPQHLHEKQRRADAQKRRRVVSGLFGVPQPTSWAEELQDYPFSDHSYFALERSSVEAAMLSLPDELEVGSPSSTMQNYRIGPSGVVKKQPHSRKQSLKARPETPPPQHSRTGQFMPIHMQPQYTDTGYGKEEEIIEQELMREVTEIAQQDPVLQDLINSMQVNNGSNILNSQPIAGDVYPPQHDNLLEPGTSRVVTPPKSLNISSNMQLFDPTASPGHYQGTLGQLPTNTPTKNDLSIGSGLTPTKQNVLDFLISKLGSSELEDIDMNEDELKLLLNEHTKAEQGALLDGKSADKGGFSDSRVEHTITDDTHLDATQSIKSNPAQSGATQSGSINSLPAQSDATQSDSINSLPVHSSQEKEVEEFVTADGRVLRTTGEWGADTVKLDNLDITSIIPLNTTHSHMTLTSNIAQQSPMTVPSKSRNEVVQLAGSSQPITGVHSMSQSSGIDALLEASEISSFNQLTVLKNSQDLDMEKNSSKNVEISDGQIQFMNEIGEVMTDTAVDVSIQHEISTQAELLGHDGSDTDSSPDQESTQPVRQSPFEAEFEQFVKAPPQAQISTAARSPSVPYTISRVSGPTLPPQTSLAMAPGKPHIVVRHMLQEPATVSVVGSGDQRMLPRPGSVRLIRGPTPTVLRYSQPAAYSTLVRGPPRHRVINRAPVRMMAPPTHRVVRLSSPAMQSQVLPSPTVTHSQVLPPQPPTHTHKQVEVGRGGTKIIRIIQKPVQKESDKGLLGSHSSGTGPT